MGECFSKSEVRPGDANLRQYSSHQDSAIDVATVDANLSKCSSHQDSATFDGIVKMTGSVDNEFNKPPNFLTLFRLSLLGAIM